MKRIFISLLMCAAFLSAHAQHVNLANDLGIAEEDKEAITERIVAKVDELQRGIQDMAGIGTMSRKGKEGQRDVILKLFIAEGKPYTARVPSRWGEYKDSTCQVMMTIINSKLKKKRERRPMRHYFNQLIERSVNPNYRYKKVVIEAADAVRVDNFTKVGEGKYMATAHILQHFAGYSGDGHIIYHDYTAKTIAVEITRLEQNTEEGVVTMWNILLGDVDCDDIW